MFKFPVTAWNSILRRLTAVGFAPLLRSNRFVTSSLVVLLFEEDPNFQEPDEHQPLQWFEELLEPDLKWSFQLNSVLHAGISEYQNIVLLDTNRFGKVLVIDGMMQSAERDEFVYHECLVHPALLIHENPKTVFIMGGGEGSTARKVLKHNGVNKVVMCDVDRVVVDFCRMHLTANQEAFSDKMLHCVINDAEVELENRDEKFDIIIGDLADPIDGGPCNHLYAKSFYEKVIKTKLNDSGIFVTHLSRTSRSSLAQGGLLSNLQHHITDVIAYTAHVPSYADSCGWVLASDHLLKLDVEKIDKKIRENIMGDLLYLDGTTFVSSTAMNKIIKQSLQNETHVLSQGNARYIHGHGVAESTLN